MIDEHYINPRLAALYDITCGWSPDRTFYLELAGAPPQRILDIGCGTGLLCRAYAARGHAVTGADPAAAMLDIARGSPEGAAVRWVEASAATFSADESFDLVIMTGHAFQVLLSDAEIAAALAVVRRHLAPGGRFVFESRNPAIDWAAEWAHVEESIATDDGAVAYTVHFGKREGELATFTQSYAFADETLVSHSTLRFASRETITGLLAAAGLEVEALYGDWERGTFDARRSEEMIFVAVAA